MFTAECAWHFETQFYPFFIFFQPLDEVIKDLMASVHRELSDKQSLAFSMTFLPTKLELTTASAETSFIFEFATPDARSSFEQAFEEAKKKLGKSKKVLEWDTVLFSPLVQELKHVGDFMSCLTFFKKKSSYFDLNMANSFCVTCV